MMKIISTISMFMVFAFLISCKKDLAELNKNPNYNVAADEAKLFRSALISGVGNYNNDVSVEQWGLMNYMMYFADRTGISPSKEYQIPTGKDAFWDNKYADVLSNIREVIKITQNTDKTNEFAVAQIWEVYQFHILTDLWGNIPYSDALKGITELNFTPKYDKQRDIYFDMLAKLKQSAEMLDISKPLFPNSASGANYTSADLIFSGDILKWIKLNNCIL